MLGESSHCEIRPGQPSDAPALSEVFRTSWASAYRGIIPHLHLDSLIKRRTSDWWGTTMRSGGDILVLQVADTVVGYATLGSARARGRYEGEVYDTRSTFRLPTRDWVSANACSKRAAVTSTGGS
ncbi:MAG: hypothetical protein WDN31_00615 [Hyphomicrobium sp.]